MADLNLMPELVRYEGVDYERNMRFGTGGVLQVILKVAERCNIACTYCYFFFGGDESYKDNPAYMSADTVKDFAQFVRDAINDYNLDLVRIIIHGGEPLMMKKSRMRSLLEQIEQASKGTTLQFTIQTNGMLIDDEWVDLFSEHNVYVGISLDGPKEVNDQYRLDKRSRGTYDRTMLGVEKLFEAYRQKRLARPGLLCVVNPKLCKADVLYRHFVEEVGFRNIDFLLPDSNHDNMRPEDAHLYKEYMLELFALYRAETRPDVQIRYFDKFINAMTMHPFFASVLHRFYTQKDVIFTVSSKGDIAPDDILRSTNPALMRASLSVCSNNLGDVLMSEEMNRLHDASFTLPTDCIGCEWANVCRGGDLYHRYRSGSGFDNRSIYCDTLKAIYGCVAELLVDAGTSLETIEARLAAPLSQTV